MTEEEFEIIVRENSQRVFLIALSFTKNKTDAEDIMQNVFLKLWKNKKDFNDNAHIVKWLTVVTSNECKNLLKYYARRMTQSLDNVGEEYSFDNDYDYDLFNAVMKLPPKLSLVIHLFYYEDLSINEISQSIKISEGAVKTRLNRGREKLKEMLGEAWTNEK